MTTLRSLVPPHDLDTLCDLAASTPPGAFVELGVYQGGSAQRLYEIAERQGRTLHLFDTFDGHKQSGEFDHENHPNGRFADAIDPRELQAKLRRATIHEGTFPHTWNEWLADAFADYACHQCGRPARHWHGPGLWCSKHGQVGGTMWAYTQHERPAAPPRFSFAHVDMDLYEPTRAACELLPPMMVSGGIILFDDYFHDDCPGVTKAVDEAFPNAETVNGRRIVRIP